MIWEIKKRELPVMNFRCGIIGSSAILCCVEITQPDNSLPDSYCGSPCTVPFVPADPPKSAGVVGIHSPVSTILGVGALTQILLPVIQRVVVSMVSLFIPSAIKDYILHRDIFPTRRLMAVGIKTLRFRIPYSAPVPLAEANKVFHIDYRILSLRKWDQAVGLVERLDNRVSFHAVFHRSSLKGPFEFDRYFIAC